MKYGIAIKSLIAVMMSAGILCASAYAQDTSTTAPTKLTEQQAEMMNKQKGEAFLTTNKQKSGVVTLADGLQYRVLVAGKGPKPTKTDTVTVNYVGTLVDGMEFDSSYKRGVPATFVVSEVIAGWTEALQLMNQGSTWELYIPASLAYGVKGAPPVIGPNETLVFKVELIAVGKGS